MNETADCLDCEARVELYRGRCPRCGGASVLAPGGVPSRFAKLPFLKRLRKVWDGRMYESPRIHDGKRR